MKPIINGTLVGVTNPSEYWSKVNIPLIHCDANKPVFHESGYASGHADMAIAIPGLLNKLKELATDKENEAHVHYAEYPNSKTGWCWSWIQFKDKRAMVFLAHTYDKTPDVYHMSN